MNERFISEPIRPIDDSFDTATMAAGEPGFPQRFVWNGAEYQLDLVIGQWKDLSPCTHGSSERYVRKHWYHIRTTDGHEMKIYCDRQPRSNRKRKLRWWLYTIIESKS